MRRPEATMSGLLGAQSRPNTLEVNRRRRRRVIGTELIRPILVQVDEGKGRLGQIRQNLVQVDEGKGAIWDRFDVVCSNNEG